ncbi:MAG: HmuY family protein [Myxococcota bacterium]
MANKHFLLLLPLWALSACAPDLGTGGDGDGDGGMVGDMGGPNVAHVDEGAGVLLTTVDATSETDWVYLSLADGAQVEPTDPESDATWDIAFLRFHIKMNGGVSGSAEVGAAIIEGQAFDDVTDAPSDGYLFDEADGDDENEDPDYVLREWYGYNIMTHVLTPEMVVYVIQGREGDYKLQIENYYDEAGTSGHLQFRWGALDAP